MPEDFEIIGPLTDIEEIEDCETEISDDTTRFAICISDDDYQFSLTALKVYPVIVDPGAEETGMIRIIDDSRKDYLYSIRRFVGLTLTARDSAVVVEAMRDARTAES